MQALIPRRMLAAVAPIAATQDIRYYLQGVFLEPTSGPTRLVATNGHILAVARFVGAEAGVPPMIIPNAAVAHAIKSKADVVRLAHISGNKWELAGYAFEPIEGVYPDYRRTIPRGTTGEAGGFSAELLGAFVKSGKALKHKGAPILRQNGPKDAAIVHFYNEDDFIGVIMPMRHFTEKFPDVGMPTWGADHGR